MNNHNKRSPVIGRCVRTLLMLLVMSQLFACAYTVYDPDGKRADRKLEQADAEAAAPTRQKTVTKRVLVEVPGPSCPETDISSQLADKNFAAAKEQLLTLEQNEMPLAEKRCVLASLALWHSLPENPGFNIGRAQSYHKLASEMAAQAANPHSELLEMAVKSMIDLRREKDLLLSEQSAIRAQLAQKDATIKQLKALMLGQ